jgi:hypothetical protein
VSGTSLAAGPTGALRKGEGGGRQLVTAVYGGAWFSKAKVRRRECRRSSPWSLSSLRQKLIKIGAKVVSRGSCVTFQMAAVATPARQATHSAGDAWRR